MARRFQAKIGLTVLPALALALAAASSARIATASEELRNEALSRLKDTSARMLTAREDAVRRMREDGRYFDLQRVELPGIWTADSASGAYSKYFDAFPKSSALINVESAFSDESGGRMGRLLAHARSWTQYAYGGAQDLVLSRRSVRQNAARAEADIAKALEGKEINEIVAHSWGTAILYNLVFDGRIKPPKKIIVIGMPTKEYWLWEQLSRHTGAEVVLYTPFDRDPLSQAAELDRRMSTILREDVISRVDTRRAWDAKCEERPCNEREREGKFTRLEISKEYSHSRDSYYAPLVRGKHLQKTAEELRAEQTEAIDAALRDAFEDIVAATMADIVRERNELKARREAQDRALRLSLAELAIRGCRHPGSVTQAELDALPRPSTPRFFEGAFPAGLDADCAQSLYLSLATALGRGGRLTAAQAVPFVPVAARAAAPVFTPRAKAPPESLLVKSGAKAPLAAFFPELKIIAQRACDAPDSLPASPLARLPLEALAYASTDEQTAGGMTAALDLCARVVFLALVRGMREGRPGGIDKAWVLAQAAAARPAPAVWPSPPDASGPVPEYTGGPQTMPSWAPNVPKNW